MTSSALQQLSEAYNLLFCNHKTELSPAEVAEILVKQQSDRDEILLQLSTVRVLLSGSPNAERTAVCEAIITTADFLYSILVRHLNSRDQFVSFTASKALCAVFAYPDLELKLEWLNAILNHISPEWIANHVALYCLQIFTELLKCLRKRQKTCVTKRDSCGQKLTNDKLKVCFSALEFSLESILQSFSTEADKASNTSLELSLGEFLSLMVEILRHGSLTPSMDSRGVIPSSPSVSETQEAEQLLLLGEMDPCECHDSRPPLPQTLTVSSCQTLTVSPLSSCQHKIISHLYQITLLLQHCGSHFLLKKLIDIFIKVVNNPTLSSNEASQLHLCVPLLLKSKVVSKVMDSWMQNCGISLVRDNLSRFVEVQMSSALSGERMQSVDNGQLNTVARKLVLFLLELLHLNDKCEHTVSPSLDGLSQQVQGSLASAGITVPQELVPPVVRSVLFQVLSEQDDCIVEALMACCRIYRLALTQSSGVDTMTIQDLFSRVFNAHSMFIEFLGSISYDHSVLLDFLMSPESKSADFLKEYLQVVVSDWSGLERACQEYDVRAQGGSEASDLPSSLQMDAYREESAGGSGYLRDVPAAKKLKLDLPLLPHYDSTPDTNSEHSDVCSTEARSGCTTGSIARSNCTTDSEAMSVGAADSDTDEGPSFHETVLDKISGCCIRLKYTLARLHSKGLFPYPVEGIIPLLERLEEMYEVGTRIP